jgi:hypothetical protein
VPLAAGVIVMPRAASASRTARPGAVPFQMMVIVSPVSSHYLLSSL